MPCTYIPGDDGGNGSVIICGPGPYSHLVRASCPWCCLGSAKTIHATRLVFDGWCAPDLVCGRCGQFWSADMEELRGTAEERRETNIAQVRAMKRAGLRPGPFPRPSGL